MGRRTHITLSGYSWLGPVDEGWATRRWMKARQLGVHLRAPPQFLAALRGPGDPHPGRGKHIPIFVGVIGFFKLCLDLFDPARQFSSLDHWDMQTPIHLIYGLSMYMIRYKVCSISLVLENKVCYNKDNLWSFELVLPSE